MIRETNVNETHSLRLIEKIWAANTQREDLVKRVANALREEITSGKLSPGAKLLPEAQLAVELGVSRPSLREAIRILAHEGRIVVKHGIGTFVGKEPKLLGPLELMRSMTELIRAAGGVPSIAMFRSISWSRRVKSRRSSGWLTETGSDSSPVSD